MEVIGSEFNYFEALPTQSSYVSNFQQDFHPCTTLNHLSPIVFDIPGADNLYINLSKTLLQLSVVIRKPDGTAVADSKAAPVNLPLHSLFSNVELRINNTICSDQNNFYGYRAYLESLLSYGKDVQNTQLRGPGFEKDTAGQLAVADVAGANDGLTKRYNLFKGKIVYLIGRPHLDMFHQPRPILPRTPIRLNFIRNTDAFCMQQAAGADAKDYRLEIIGAILRVEYFKMSDPFILAHEKILQGTNALYPYKHTKMQIWTIPTGSSKVQHELYSGTIPDLILMAFLNHEAMTGSYQLNPYHFQDFGINDLFLNVNGEMVPAQPFRPDVANGDALREYYSIFDTLNCLFGKDTANITYEEFLAGYFILGFMLTSDHSQATIDTRKGAVRAQIGFKAATTAGINVLLYSSYSTFLEIDKYRNVITHLP